MSRLDSLVLLWRPRAYGEAKPLIFEGFNTGPNVVLLGRCGTS